MFDVVQCSLVVVFPSWVFTSGAVFVSILDLCSVFHLTSSLFPVCCVTFPRPVLKSQDIVLVAYGCALLGP